MHVFFFFFCFCVKLWSRRFIVRDGIDLFVRTMCFSFKFLICFWICTLSSTWECRIRIMVINWLVYCYLVLLWWVSYCLIRCFHDSSIETIVGCLFWMLICSGVLWSLATHTFNTHCFFWFTEVFRTSLKFLWNRYL